jgi:DNA-binding MarR family transcriptional regulator
MALIGTSAAGHSSIVLFQMRNDSLPQRQRPIEAEVVRRQAMNNEITGEKLNRMLAALGTAIDELGANLPPRQLMAILLIARANRAGTPIGVRDIDFELGDLKSGSSSKLLRTMMHVEGERKQGVANTVKAERDPKDLRKWNLTLTPKGEEVVNKILTKI